MKVENMVTNEYCKIPVSEEELKKHKKTLVYRHIAWMTALRYNMRQRKSWETQHKAITNQEWRDMIHIPEEVSTLEDNLMIYLSEDEEKYVLSKSNKQTAILYLQSKHIRELKEKGLIWEFAFLELENVLESLFTHQGKSERIKNFPYPRQYASLGLYLTRVFTILLPFGLIPEFAELGETTVDSFYLVGKYAFFTGGVIGLVRIIDLFSVLKPYDIVGSVASTVFQFALWLFFSHLHGKEGIRELNDGDIFKMDEALEKLNLEEKNK
jgi:putative membrane protein